jgi:serine/threonine protein kinase/Tfp pilus assembly protein PilF
MQDNLQDLTAEIPLEEEVLALGRLPIGSVINGQFQVAAYLGSGEMGRVYKVAHLETRKVFALKTISPEMADAKVLAKRLEHEAEAVRKLVHANIVSVYDVGVAENGAPYLVMDYIEGECLHVLLNSLGRVPQNRALPIFIQIAKGLTHAHEKAVIHRDLKPNNIIISKAPDGHELVKIVDFGIAKLADQESADKTKLTQDGELVGTPLYMSPEQCLGDEIDPRSDLYSFGCIMYETLTGSLPFNDENFVKVILRHLSLDAPPIPDKFGVSEDMNRVILRCLEKHRDNRYPDADALLTDLHRIADGQGIIPHKRKAKKAARKRPPLVALVLGAIAVCSIGIYAVTTMLTPVPTNFSKEERHAGKTLSEWTAEIEKNPDDPELYINRGTLHSIRDERNNAIDDLTQALELKPDHLKALAQRAHCYLLTAKYEKALEDANRIIKLKPDSADGYARRAMIYQTCEMFGESRDDWERAIELDPKNGYFCYGAAQNLMPVGRFDDAARLLKKSITLGDKANNAYSALLGRCYTYQQKYDKAFEYLNFNPAKQKVRGVEWASAAFYYLCVGKTDAAQKAMNQVMARETFPARSHRILGELARCAGQYEKAIQEFHVSTSLEETYPVGYRQRGMSFFALGQFHAALADFKKAYQLNPESSTTATWLARAENKLGKKDEAQKLLKKAFEEQLLAPMSYVNRGYVELENGNIEGALESARVALVMDPWLKEGYELRAAVRRKAGDKTQAAMDAETAKKMISHFDL